MIKDHVVVVYTNNNLSHLDSIVGPLTKEEADKYKSDNDFWGSMIVLKLKSHRK